MFPLNQDGAVTVILTNLQEVVRASFTGTIEESVNDKVYRLTQATPLFLFQRHLGSEAASIFRLIQVA